MLLTRLLFDDGNRVSGYNGYISAMQQNHTLQTYYQPLLAENTAIFIHTLFYSQTILFNKYRLINLPIKLALTYAFSATLDPLVAYSGYAISRLKQHQAWWSICIIIWLLNEWQWWKDELLMVFCWLVYDKLINLLMIWMGVSEVLMNMVLQWLIDWWCSFCV